jgi:RNA polymerase primary sigma factor
MSRAHLRDERLVARVLGGDAAAAREFVELAGSIVWPAVRQLVGEGPEAETAFLTVMRALKHNGAARLRRFDGGCELPRFLLLTARDVLAEEVARTFSLDPNRAWRRFERFFAADIKRRVRARFPRADAFQRDDLYQEVTLKLVEGDYKRIRSFSGNGSFTGYVLGVVENLLRDLVRREAPRRRLPAAVERLSPLHQSVFAAVVWRDIPPSPERLAPALRTALGEEVDRDALMEALADLAPHMDRVRTEAALRPTAASAADLAEGEFEKLADPAPGAEEQIIRDAEEAKREALVALIRRKADDLPKADRLYLQLIFYQAEPAKPREIAKTMSVPVEEVYRLRERTMRWLRDVAKDFQPGAVS